MDKLIKIENIEDILPIYKNTAIEKLLKYHNLDYKFEEYDKAELLVGMCMDNRKQLNIPNNFAYILRTGGGNLRYSEFKISYAIAVGGVKTLALIGHNHCGMVNLMNKKEKFIQGLVDNAGWNMQQAEEHFMSFAPMFEIENEISFLLSETKRLREKYPKISIAPLFYNVDDNLLYLVKENS
ncbi:MULTISPECIES: carbonic anhydrase [Clostridium]|uniref:Carbonic anhydrase n=1 Tax=Clostridium sporogenes TaxID=1509 RepID=A0A7X5P7J4_CLOSG|nr:carbonic anhydrase [Clostridium sporogenes]AJD31044.1 carbonic anhydrase family protein [Clostridium botulinum Prevot_594]KRU37652.1 carbonic anhydrase [Clostridium sporogenes]MBY7014843.1 carbonic anhydrase [Clostridium sporogenes]MBY7064836.1 carbonic anhydrase [Clostridium sporogenes]MBY7069267.1 carbonic anhydrase [Clostridium sporogenes]